MPDIEKVIRGLECCLHVKDCNCGCCPYDDLDLRCKPDNLYNDVMELLKAQGPRLIVDEDFDNPAIANASGEIPCWMENRKYDEVSPGVLTPRLFGEKHIGERYWTSRPTDEQRKAVKWDS